MTPIEPGSGKEAGTYWLELLGLWPLIIIGGIMAVITNLRKLSEMPSKKRIPIELFITFVIGAGAALVAVGILPLVFGDISPKIEIGVAGLAGSFGQKSFDLIVKRLLGRGNHES